MKCKSMQLMVLIINVNYKVTLNMGIYDATNKVPINLSFKGFSNRNCEVRLFKEMLADNIDNVKNIIFVCDRLYFCYELIDYMLTNGIHFIIRVKGHGDNVDNMIDLNKNTVKHDYILNIRDKCRLIRCDKSYTQMVLVNNKKGKCKTVTINRVSDYIILTDLPEKDYSDDRINELYHSRWDIEVFYKLIKTNFNFSNLHEDNTDTMKKMYVSELIIVYLLKFIEKYYWSKK